MNSTNCTIKTGTTALIVRCSINVPCVWLIFVADMINQVEICMKSTSRIAIHNPVFARSGSTMKAAKHSVGITGDKSMPFYAGWMPFTNDFEMKQLKAPTKLQLGHNNILVLWVYWEWYCTRIAYVTWCWQHRSAGSHSLWPELSLSVSFSFHPIFYTTCVVWNLGLTQQTPSPAWKVVNATGFYHTP